MAKTKEEQLVYVWNGRVLKVTTPDGESESFDFNELPRSLDENFYKFARRTKLGNFATDCPEPSDKLRAMRDGFAVMRDGDWEKPKTKLPDWIKGRTANAAIAALGILTGKAESDVRSSLIALGQAQAESVMKSAKVQAKVAELASAGAVDFSDFVE